MTSYHCAISNEFSNDSLWKKQHTGNICSGQFPDTLDTGLKLEGKNFWDELNGRGGGFERCKEFLEESESVLSWMVSSVLYFCQCLIRSQSRKYLPINV